MVGGGPRARPGEVSLAHNGVLFLDELPEFTPQVLDSLRQPLESGETVIARAMHRVTYPSRFQLIAAMNPCRCGMAGEPGHTCRRGARCAADYQARVSGPLLDRIDIRLEVPAVTAADLILPPPSEGSVEVAARVAAARAVQADRFKALGLDGVRTNADCPARLFEDVSRPDAGGLALLRDAADSLKLTARGFHRVLRVARTLADLDGSDSVGRLHIAEAVGMRGAGSGLLAAA
jgi:magnesium chelatase family protein